MANLLLKNFKFAQYAFMPRAILKANIVWEIDVTDVVLKAFSKGIDTVVALLTWEKFTQRWKNKIKTDPKEYYLSVDWIHVTQDKGILEDPFEHSNKPSGSIKKMGKP